MCGSDVSMIRFRKEKNEKIMKKKEIGNWKFASYLHSCPPTLPYLPTYLPSCFHFSTSKKEKKSTLSRQNTPRIQQLIQNVFGGMNLPYPSYLPTYSTYPTY